MDQLVRLLGACVAVVLIVAAFAYLFSAQAGLKLLRRTGSMLAVAVLALTVAVLLARHLDPLVFFLAAVLVSLGAYALRQSRLERGADHHSYQGAERIPIFPNMDESDELDS